MQNEKTGWSGSQGGKEWFLEKMVPHSWRVLSPLETDIVDEGETGKQNENWSIRYCNANPHSLAVSVSATRDTADVQLETDTLEMKAKPGSKMKTGPYDIANLDYTKPRCL